MIGINNGGTLPNRNIVSLKRYKLKDGVEYLNKELDYLKYRLSLGSGMVMPFITDIHYAISSDTQFGYNRIKKNFSIYKEEPDNTTWEDLNANTYNSNKIPDRVERATAVLAKLAENNKIDCVVLGGDYEQGFISNSDYKEMVEEQSTMFDKLSLKCPVMIIKGNHDANAFIAPKESNNENAKLRSVGAQEYEESSLKNIHLNSEIHFGPSKTYGYYDNVKNKIRVVFLNIYDFDIKTNPNYAISHQNWFIGQTQLQWLVNTAFDFTGKSGWNVVICSHTRIFHSSERGFAYTPSYGYNVFKIFVSFNHKISGSIKLSATGEAAQYNINTINYDFSVKNAGGNKILCNVCGHTHIDRLSQGFYYYNPSQISGTGKYRKINNTYKEISGFLPTIDLENWYYKSGTDWIIGTTNRYVLSCIEVDSLGQPSGAIYKNKDENYRKYIDSNYSNVRDSIFDTLQFDLKNNKIWCHKYGIGESRCFNIQYNKGIPNLKLNVKNITITVINKNNSVLSNAKVTIKYNGGSITKTTNNEGKALFEYMPIDKCKITVSCAGYKDTKEIEETNVNFLTKTITLEKDNSYIPPAETSDSISNYTILNSISSIDGNVENNIIGAYIDTQIPINQNSIKIETEFKPISNTNIFGDTDIFGGVDSSTFNGLRLWYEYESGTTISLRLQSGSSLQNSKSYIKLLTNATTNKNIITVEVTNKQPAIITLNGNKITSNGNVNLSTTSTRNILLFASSIGNNIYTGKLIMYPTKIYINTILQRDYVPVKRISDSEIGMYDKVNNKFYGSVNNYKFTE